MIQGGEFLLYRYPPEFVSCSSHLYKKIVVVSCMNLLEKMSGDLWSSFLGCSRSFNEIDQFPLLASPFQERVLPESKMFTTNQTFSISAASGRCSGSFSRHLATKSLNSCDHLFWSFNGGIPFVVIKNSACWIRLVKGTRLLSEEGTPCMVVHLLPFPYT